ncbi:ShlB/FhaC/HecB family hemolysin secretion/activation protein [Morganella psychrotolerans]|uniref:Hemolysin activation protein n=1 Tax=Morganella psychrotolerans TaxID=368603 RepID=A0A1B8HMX9_9GAMM|nr:ShlB/FhaC/HecB family hemolysin secretion/activation protein [Morganella psychrotolerans]OBU10803.1 hemolysin activation protein [Morganella psychrotolerans]
MTKLPVLLILLCQAAIAAPFPSVPDNPGVDASRRALQDTTHQVNDLLEQQAYQQLNKSQNTKPAAESVLQLTANDHCLPVTGVYLSGVALLSQADLSSLSPLPAQCIRSRDINILVAELMERYLAKGYITARIRFLPVNTYQEIGIGVTEGIIERIDGADGGVNTAMLFPSLTGKPLKITELEQGLDQANRLRSNHVTMDILPGELPGGSVVSLNNQRGTPLSLALTADNYGQKSTGRRQVRATASADSPAGLSDFLSLNGSTTTDDRKNRYSRSGMLFYSVPYGALTVSTYASLSGYRIDQALRYNRVILNGDSAQAALRADYAIFRNQTRIDSLMAQITYKRSRNYINDTLIGVSSPSLSIAEAGYTGLLMVPGGVISTTISAEKGTTLFGADTRQTLPGSDPQYTKGKFSLNYIQGFSLSGDVYLLSSNLTGQYTQDNLPGVEWLTLSGSNAVRGFGDGSLSADKGWYWQNTLSRRFVRQGVAVTPRAGVDYGRVMAQTGHAGWQSATGIAAGINFSYGGALLDAQISRARTTAAAIPAQDTLFSLRLGYQF